MNNLLEIILAVISSSAITSLFTLRPKRRSSDTESYKMLLDDLNGRMAAALDRMKELEAELSRMKEEYSALKIENEQLKIENENLKTQLRK